VRRAPWRPPFVVFMANEKSILGEALADLAPYYRQVIFFGLFINFMVLTPSWYMLEVYDRVIHSRNALTLGMLTGMAVFIYLVMESLEWVRRKMLREASQAFGDALQTRLFHAAFEARMKVVDFPIQQVFSDFRAMRECISSPAILALVDIPYVLIFVAAVFLIHPAWVDGAGRYCAAERDCRL